MYLSTTYKELGRNGVANELTETGSAVGYLRETCESVFHWSEAQMTDKFPYGAHMQDQCIEICGTTYLGDQGG